MFKKSMILVASVAVVAAAGCATAVGMPYFEETHDLRDGSTVYVFPDGKMAMEDKYGRPIGMTPGQEMEMQDGRRLTMVGNEVARLDAIKRQERGGN